MSVERLEFDEKIKLIPIIKKLNYIRYSQTETTEKKCPISFEDFEEGENIVMLPCNHIFKKKPLLKWISNKKTCPLCRGEIVKETNLNNVLPPDIQRVKSLIEMYEKDDTDEFYYAYIKNLISDIQEKERIETENYILSQSNSSSL